eukprot:TRINITY_DN1594_c0_g1_i2.p1 TRINITY_DN1594_c0_g1~~TRINITY_DN1594_c0_g1_i2.p1  ORF type:complete len:421 (+),score=93.75 TRINITY_DN1594_c0_g1_i2:713-1975(+)
MQRRIIRAVRAAAACPPAPVECQCECSLTPACGAGCSDRPVQAGVAVTVATKPSSSSPGGGGAPPLPKAAGSPTRAGHAGHPPNCIEESSPAIKAEYGELPAVLPAASETSFLLDAEEMAPHEHRVDVQMSEIISSDAAASGGVVAYSYPLVAESVPSSPATAALEAAPLAMVAEQEIVVEPANQHVGVTSTPGIDEYSSETSLLTDAYRWAVDPVAFPFSGDALPLTSIDMSACQLDEVDFDAFLQAAAAESAADVSAEFHSAWSAMEPPAVIWPPAVGPPPSVGSPMSRLAHFRTLQVPPSPAQMAPSIAVTTTTGGVRSCERANNCRLPLPLIDVSHPTRASVEEEGPPPSQVPAQCRQCTGGQWDPVEHKWVCCKARSARAAATSAAVTPRRDPGNGGPGAGGNGLLDTTSAVTAA